MKYIKYIFFMAVVFVVGIASFGCNSQKSDNTESQMPTTGTNEEAKEEEKPSADVENGKQETTPPAVAKPEDSSGKTADGKIAEQEKADGN